jgi:hypothetical protein
MGTGAIFVSASKFSFPSPRLPGACQDPSVEAGDFVGMEAGTACVRGSRAQHGSHQQPVLWGRTWLSAEMLPVGAARPWAELLVEFQ